MESNTLILAKIRSETVQTAELVDLTVSAANYSPVGDCNEGLQEKRKREDGKDERPDKRGTGESGKTTSGFV